jgi:hypothetical protein
MLVCVSFRAGRREVCCIACGAGLAECMVLAAARAAAAVHGQTVKRVGGLQTMLDVIWDA